MNTQFLKLWHDIAVGMFYREQMQTGCDPKAYYHWEHQSLGVKLHYQAKAKKELRELTGESQ